MQQNVCGHLRIPQQTHGDWHSPSMAPGPTTNYSAEEEQVTLDEKYDQQSHPLKCLEYTLLRDYQEVYWGPLMEGCIFYALPPRYLANRMILP